LKKNDREQWDLEYTKKVINYDSYYLSTHDVRLKKSPFFIKNDIGYDVIVDILLPRGGKTILVSVPARKSRP
jgi:hypothetical protein